MSLSYSEIEIAAVTLFSHNDSKSFKIHAHIMVSLLRPRIWRNNLQKCLSELVEFS